MSRALHALLRRLLPARVRRRHNDAMAEAFAAALHDARSRGRVAVARTWLREVIDLGSTAIRLRARRAEPGRGPLRRSAPRRPSLPGSMVGDLRSAARTLRRRPLFASFAAAIMALGIASATTVFSAVQAAVLDVLPYDNADRIVALFESSGSDALMLSPTPESVRRWRAQRDVFEAVEPIGWTTKRLTGAGPATTVEVALIRPQFNAMVDRHPALGRPFTDAELRGDGDHVALLGHRFWANHFAASPDVLGKSIELDGEPWTIVGVMPADAVLPTFSTAPHDLWLPLSETRQANSTSVAALMRTSVTVDDLSRRFDALHRQEVGERGDEAGPKGVAMLVGKTRGDDMRSPLTLLSIAVGLLLLIACINVANLLLGAATQQRHELAVRIALGASWSNIFRQLLAQSLLLAGVGAGLGVLLARSAMASIAALRPARLELLDNATISWKTLVFAVAVMLLAGLAAGLFPAVAVSRRYGERSLRSRTPARGAGQRARWGLIAAEVALSFVLLASCFVVAADVYRLQRADVGFQADRVAAVGVSLPPWKYPTGQREAAWSSIAARLAALPGVERLTPASGMPPRTGVTWGAIAFDDDSPGEEPQLLFGPAVGPDYFATVGQEMVAGRPFTADEIRDQAKVVIIGEEVARRFLGGRDPLGARMRFGDDGWEATPEEEDRSRIVVGVARDIAMQGPVNGSVLQMYTPLATGDDAGAYRMFIMRAADGHEPRALLPAAREIVVAQDPDILIMTLDTGDGLMRATLGRQRFMTSLLSAFALLALVLAAAGLYGVIAELVGQRRHELGIRMALGADGRAIRRAVLRGGTRATAAGLATGFPLLWLAGRLATVSALRDVTAAPPLVVLGAAGTVVGAALLAAYVPARHATRIDPLTAMRSDRWSR